MASKRQITLLAVVLAGIGAVALAPTSARAEIGLSVDTSAMHFIYTKGAGGPSSIGRITIGTTASSSILVEQSDLGRDLTVGGGDDTVIDLARIAPGGASSFNLVFQADVFQLGPNQYSLSGTYQVDDALPSSSPVIQGQFNSNFVGLAGGTFSFGGNLANPDGILRPGGPATSWTFTGDPASTPNMVNGVFGGADGIDGSVTLARFRESATLASLFDFQFVASFPNLDAFFNSTLQASTLADMKVTTVVVPAPGAVWLGVIGLGLIQRLKRRLG